MISTYYLLEFLEDIRNSGSLADWCWLRGYSHPKSWLGLDSSSLCPASWCWMFRPWFLTIWFTPLGWLSISMPFCLAFTFCVIQMSKVEVTLPFVTKPWNAHVSFGRFYSIQDALCSVGGDSTRAWTSGGEYPRDHLGAPRPCHVVLVIAVEATCIR